jgi:hypothetical protein
MQEPATFTCGICHEEHPLSQRHIFDGTELCETCYETETTTCDHCGERIWTEDAETDEYTSLCLSCYDRDYSRCHDCGQIIHNSNAYYPDEDYDFPYCSHCIDYAQHSKTAIHTYSYKPIPIFYGTGTRYLGVELEVDEGGESSDHATELLTLANAGAEHIYCKHDGSLVNGFEIVTHPMTLDYHQKQMPWEAVVDHAVAMGYLSHQTTSCGLHVHVNRNSFGATDNSQEAAIARVLFFVENHWNELLRFSRRTQRQMEQWAARYGRKDNPKEQLEHVKNNYSDRYRAINLTNRSTIEFRLFRGTLRYNTLIATLQLVNEICEVACCLCDDELARLTWTDFCARIGNLEYPELVQYLKERRLYISDPISAEEEF